jgi:hypothetical protein
MLAGATPGLAQGPRFALGASIVGEHSSDAALILLSVPYLPMASPSESWSVGPTVGLGIVESKRRAQDFPFLDLTVEGGRVLRRFARGTGGIAARAGMGAEVLTPFDTATATFPGGGRHTVVSAIARLEMVLYGRPSASSPALITVSAGRTTRFGEEIELYGLPDVWYLRFGFEVSTR